MAAALATVTALTMLVTSRVPASAAEPVVGDHVYVSSVTQGYGGTSVHGIFATTPADTSNPGIPDYWAYCVEHDVSAKTNRTGAVEDPSSYLGANYFTDPAVQGKVRWVLAHSYPYLSLAAFGTAAGVPSISVNDAVEATQYAIWRYTDLTFDAAWSWEDTDSETAYWYLVDGANASAGMTAEELQTTVGITGPTLAQAADSLVGPFTVSTDQATADLSVTPALPLTDASGNPIDPSTVTDGQALYVDVRGSTAAGSATITVSAAGSSLTGDILSIPNTVGGAATAGDHAQTLILVAPSTATATDSASVSWTTTAMPPAPVIGTTLTDAADGDHTLAWSGGALIDSVAYQNLVPGTSYTLTGELMHKSDGTGTGIIGATTFTPSTATGTSDVAFTVPAGLAGQALVAFETLTETGDATVIAGHKDINDTAQTVAVDTAPAPPAGVRSQPTITTRTSASKVVVGHPFADTVTISGFEAGGTAKGTAELYGPYPSPSAATCADADLVRTVSFTSANGTTVTSAVKVTQPGYYTWVASTSADAYNDATSHRCGLATETTLVHKPSYGTPIVSTGFSGVEGSLAARPAATKLRYAGVGVSARSTAVGITDGAVDVPSNTARLGTIAASAGLGDVVGATVIVGHVSDDEDTPGAFFRLTRAKRGQVVKVTQNGHTYRFRVTSTKTYSRADSGHPPASVFSTTSAHKLVLISCANKVVRPDGRFHYTRNIVVTATPIR